MSENDDGGLPAPGEAIGRASPRSPRARAPATRMARAGRSADAKFQRAPVREEAVPRDGAHPDGRLKRTRKRSTDPTYIDPKVIPAHMSYEYKAVACFGEGQDAHVQNLRENHWTEVPAGRHPGVVVRQGGSVLMERPKYLTDEAKLEDYQIAKDQVESVGGKMRQTPHGTAPRDIPALDQVNKNNREYVPISVPEE